MTALPDYQHALLHALSGGDLTAAEALFTGPAHRRALGLRVYANNAIHALVSALADTFPVCRALLGPAAFEAAAIGYARANPARRDLLTFYGAGFAAALDRLHSGTTAAATLFGDMARLEFAWLESYHAADVPPLALTRLAAIAPAALLDARLSLHPAVRLCQLAHPVDTLWHTAQQEEPPIFQSIDTSDAAPVHLLLHRPHADVGVTRISAPLFAALQALHDGAPVGESTADMTDSADVATLQVLLADGLFTDMEIPEAS